MRRCERRCEDEQMWRWADVREDIKMRRYKDEQMWRWADVREDLKMSRCEDEQMWKWEGVREGVKMRRCEDEKMRYRPPLLEEPCAQTLSGTKTPHKVVGKKHDKQSRQNRSPIVSTGNRAVPAHFPRLGSNLSHLVSKPACLFSPAVSHSCTFTACVVPATLAQISARKTSKTQSNPARRHTSTWTVLLSKLYSNPGNADRSSKSFWNLNEHPAWPQLARAESQWCTETSDVAMLRFDSMNV